MKPKVITPRQFHYAFDLCVAIQQSEPGTYLPLVERALELAYRRGHTAGRKAQPTQEQK